MSEQTLLQLNREQHHMTRMATRTVIGVSLLIHVLLNVYARLADSAFLKVEVPIMSAVTVLAVAIALRVGKGH